MYVVIAEIPGVTKDRVTVTAKDDKVMIEGKKKKKVISSDDHYLIRERRNGLFKKMIQLPIDVTLPPCLPRLKMVFSFSRSPVSRM